MFHANFHGDFFNLSKITFFCFDLSECLPPRSFFGVVLPVTPCWVWASFAPTLGQGVVRLLKRLWRLYQPVPPQCPIPFFFFFFSFPFSPALASPLRSRVLGFLSHDGFIGGPLAGAFSLPSWSVQLGSPCCLAYQRRFVGHWAMDAEYKVISLPGSIKTTSPPPTPAIIYHLHPPSGRKLLVSLTDVYWRHLISKG